MLQLLFLGFVATLFMSAAMLIADCVMRRAPLRQDAIWRITLVAVAVLPFSALLGQFLPGLSVNLPAANSMSGVRHLEVGSASLAPPGRAADLAAKRDWQISAADESREGTTSLSVPQHLAPTMDSDRSAARGEERKEGRAAEDERTRSATGAPAMPMALEPRRTPSELASDRQRGLAVLLGWCAGVWLLGASVKSLLLWRGYRRHSRRASQAEPGTGTAWQVLADQLRKSQGYNSVPVRFCPHASTPFIAGLRKPAVIIPEVARSMSDERTVQQILVHEFSHLERRDHWFNLLLQAVGVILWLHPMYYWMRRRIQWLREVICDANVVRAAGEAVPYAETLLMLSCRAPNQGEPLWAVGMASPRSMVGRRIANLLDDAWIASFTRSAKLTRSLGWLVAVLAWSAAGMIQFTSGAAPTAGDEPAQVAEQHRDNVAGQVAGVVTLPGGKPAVKAAVYLRPSVKGAVTLPVHPQIAHTDEAGRYAFNDLAAGVYQLWAETSELTSLEQKLRGQKIEVLEGKPTPPLNLSLHEGCRYSVQVIDKANRQPIAKANISFGWTDIDRNYQTDERGVSEIGGLAMDEWYFVVKAEGYAIAYRKLPKQSLGSKTEVIFELAPGATVEGTIRDADGKPVAGATIQAQDKNGGMTPGLGRIQSNADGTFRFTSMPQAMEVAFFINAEGFLRFQGEATVPLDQTEFRQDFTLVKRPYGGDCIVTVIDEVGKPISGAEIENMGNSSADVRRATSDAAGIARLNDLYSGFRGIAATVRAPGYVAAQTDLTSGTQENPGQVTVRLKKGAAIRGRLLKPNGEPAAGVWVFYNRGEQGGIGGLGGRVDTDHEGRFQIDGLPNPCTFTIYTPAPFAPIRDRPLPVGGDEEVVVTMEPEGVIKVRAVDASTHKPIPEFNVQVTFTRDGRPGDPSISLLSNLSNPGTEILGEVKEFRLGQLPVGMPLQVTVAAKGYSKTVLKRVEAAVETELKTLDVELAREDESMFRKLTGQLRDPAGKPVAGATLKLIVGAGRFPADGHAFNWQQIEMGQVERDAACLQLLTTTTARDGSFQFDRVQNSEWLEITHTGGHTANGWYAIASAEVAAVKNHLTIEALLPAKLKVAIDRKRFPEAHSISLFPTNASIAFSYTTRTLMKDTSEIIFDRLPPGNYRIGLDAKPLEVGNGGFQVRNIEAAEISLEADQEKEISF